MKLIKLLLLVILFSACSKDKNRKTEIEYYLNGIVKASYTIQNNKITGLVIYNYESGKKHFRSIYRNNILNGYFIEYYENGNVKVFGHFSQAQKSGRWVFYHENGRLSKVQKYLKNKGKYNCTQYINYDKKGNIIKNKSMFLLFNKLKDTITDGDEFTFGVRLEGSRFGNMMTLFGDYDKEFYLHDSINVDTLYGEDFTVFYNTRKYKLGLNTIRGVVYDYKCESEKNGVLYKIYTIYFEDNFFVKPKK